MLGPEHLRRPLPDQWKMLIAVDTGTYMSAAFMVFPPDSVDGYVLEEFPNYRYVAGGEIELVGGDMGSIPGWSRVVMQAYRSYFPGKSKLSGWCDENSQFKTELANYGINLRGNNRKLELRVEITREYFNHRHIFLAPWLEVLPYEIEHAVWPEEVSRMGRFEREKEHDHTLDCIEHICSRRPRHRALIRDKKETFLEQFYRENRRAGVPKVDRHLGAN